MPRKIGFFVVNSSSHEDNFSAEHLMVHAPTVSGWRSSRQCTYPQHITLQLAERSRVKKLQLLAHQYLIPSKVEFHIGDSLPEPGTSVFPEQLHRLGYVALSDNEKKGFKTRELKSVRVDAIGTYLRISFHRNHVNRHNHYNQVALVAINVLGDSVVDSDLNTLPSREQLIEHYLNSTQLEAALDTTFMGKCESISPLDDLAFDMYQDPEVAHIIRLMDQKKQDMVRQEKYEQVKNLKQAIADLQKVGERLVQFDVEKRCAIEREDYDVAKKKKEHMEEYRRTVYQQLKVHNLLDMEMITKAAKTSPALDPSVPRPFSGHPSVLTMTNNGMRNGRKSNPSHDQLSGIDPVVFKWSNPPDTPLSPSAAPKTDVISVPHDEVLLPALRKVQAAEATQSPALDHFLQHDAQRSPPSPKRGEPEPLSDRAQREAGLSVEVFGEALIAKAYSKTWFYREDALMTVHKRLLEVSPTTPKEELRNMIRATVLLVKKALLDNVFYVFQASLKLLQLMLGQLIPGLGLGRAEMTHCLEQTWPSLLARTGESASRLRLTATAFIQEIAVVNDVRTLHVIPCELVKPFKSNFPSRLAQSRVELVEKLLAELGTESSGFTLDNVMMFSTPALEHSAPTVREVAVRIVLSMYKQHGNTVLGYLPPSNSSARKDFLYRTLFDGFSKIDGTSVETKPMKKGGVQQDGQREKEEIHTLQEQLAALREITENDNESTKGQTGKQEAHKAEKSHKTAVTKAPQNKVPHPADIQTSTTYLDNLCIFCGKKDPSFTEDGLDRHYWKHCPMLQRCDECKEVVEISCITEHLLGECERRSKFSQCPCCSEAVTTEHLTLHIQGPACNPPISGKAINHCPLCHNNFILGEEAWKAHLMGRDGCKQNSRRTVVSQRTQPAQGRTVAGPKPSKPTWSGGARPRPMGRGSRIPALSPLAKGQASGKQ